MFNWELFAVILAISLPGILISVPKTVVSMIENAKAKLPPGKKLPSITVIKVVSIFQTLLLVSIAIIMGILLAPKVGYQESFFEALLEGKPIWEEVKRQLMPALGYGTIGAIIFIGLYYQVFRPRLDKETLKALESFRQNMGLESRILYGGVVEEVLIRWGFLLFVLWILQLVSGSTGLVVIWVSIVLSGIVFAIGHLPAYLGAGCKPTPVFLAAMLVLNLWASLLFGYLFWYHGLLAAIFAHMLFHLLWYPFDRYYFSKGQ